MWSNISTYFYSFPFPLQISPPNPQPFGKQFPAGGRCPESPPESPGSGLRVEVPAVSGQLAQCSHQAADLGPDLRKAAGDQETPVRRAVPEGRSAPTPFPLADETQKHASCQIQFLLPRGTEPTNDCFRNENVDGKSQPRPVWKDFQLHQEIRCCQRVFNLR